MVTETIKAIGDLLGGIGTLLAGAAKIIKECKTQKKRLTNPKPGKVSR